MGRNKEHLLNSKEVARFITDGYLRWDELVPQDINERAVAAMDANEVPRHSAGTPFPECWTDNVMGEVFRLPKVQGIIESLVGPNPLYDHCAIHTVGANNPNGQVWHADAIIDLRLHFDIQFFYFAHDTPREMGGTMILPGSQYRRISETDIGRYQNFLGQEAMDCKAGTLVVVHHGIWHCAQPNRTDRRRYMFKLRLNPTVRQKLLWNTDDLNDGEVSGIMGANHRWYGNEVRIETVNRIRQWRFLVGDETFDAHYWMSRIENMPENLLLEAV